jgi:hypothetical protein
MAIDVVWQDENGAAPAHCPTPYEWRVGRAVPPERSHCLQYIDPVGDATFNQLQLPRLIRELDEAVAALQASPFQRQAAAVLEFVRGCVGVHTYVKFIGD